MKSVVNVIVHSVKELLVLGVIVATCVKSEAEIAAVSDVLRSGWITTGPKTKEFEAKLHSYIFFWIV